MTKEWEKPEDLRRRKPVLWLTMTALFMAMVVVLSMSALSMLAMMSAPCRVDTCTLTTS